jgi:hypothetical protein
MMKALIPLIFLFAVGCYYDANIRNKRTSQSSQAPPAQETEAPSSPWHNGETVTTSNGVAFQGSFGEIVERQTLSNGTVIEGVAFE